jgi:hypothetical protein
MIVNRSASDMDLIQQVRRLLDEATVLVGRYQSITPGLRPVVDAVSRLGAVSVKVDLSELPVLQNAAADIRTADRWADVVFLMKWVQREKDLQTPPTTSRVRPVRAPSSPNSASPAPPPPPLGYGAPPRHAPQPQGPSARSRRPNRNRSEPGRAQSAARGERSPASYKTRESDPFSSSALKKTMARAIAPGRLMWNPPETMQFGKPTRVEVRVAISTDLDKELTEGLRGPGIPRLEDLGVSPFMGVHLRGDGFDIV